MDMLQMVQEAVRLADGTTVGALDPSGGRGASKQGRAQGLIEQAAADVQVDFVLSINRFEDVELTPDINGYLQFDGSTISVEAGKNWPHERISLIGNRIYDHANNTYVFPAVVYVNVRRAFTAECLPLHVQKYLVAKTALEMCDPKRDPARYQRLVARNGQARVTMLHEENRLQRPTVPQYRHSNFRLERLRDELGIAGDET